MRIAVDARELAGKATGVGRYLAELLARWTRAPEARGHRLLLVVPAAIDAESSWLGQGGAAARTVVAPGGGGTVWEQATLARTVRSLRPDVLFAPGYTAPLLGRTPLALSVHDVSFFAHPEWFSPREGLRRRLVTRAAARRARVVLTLTAVARDEIVRHLRIPASKVRVIAPAVDSHECFTSRSAGQSASRTADQSVRSAGDQLVEPSVGSTAVREPLVLYVGSIFNRRHVPELVAGFARLAERRPDVRLEVVGDNRTYPHQDLAALAASHGVGRRLAWRAYVTDAELRDLYARASVFAFLSEYEGFGLTPLEALRAGVPSVVLDTPVAREAYGDAARFVSLDDGPEAVADALERLLDDDVARTGLFDAATHVLSRYSWDRTARETLAAITEAAR